MHRSTTNAPQQRVEVTSDAINAEKLVCQDGDTTAAQECTHLALILVQLSTLCWFACDVLTLGTKRDVQGSLHDQGWRWISEGMDVCLLLRGHGRAGVQATACHRMNTLWRGTDDRSGRTAGQQRGTGSEESETAGHSNTQ